MFRSVVMKLTAVSNLNCSYCYMFNLADKTYTRVPALMAIDTAFVTLDLIRRHLEVHESSRFNIILHGGEPTLWPLDRFRVFLRRIADMRRSGITLNVTIQSNGYNLDSRLLDLLAEYGVSLGISLDGPREYNDAYRVNHKGLGSYDKIIENVGSIIQQGYGHIIGGFLTVAHPEIPPSEFLTWAKTLPVTRLSVLWPIQYNYDNPPWKGQSYEAYACAPRYGQWFAELFELWWRQDDPDLHIRHFVDSIKRMMGVRHHGDSIGNDEIDIFVVNTDGGIEYSDYLRSYTDGGSRTPFTVFADDLDMIADDPLFSYCLSLGAHLPLECHGCPHANICGGGFLPGRTKRSDRIPRRKSILCADQYYFFSAVRRIVMPHIQREAAAARQVLPAP